MARSRQVSRRSKARRSHRKRGGSLYTASRDRAGRLYRASKGRVGALYRKSRGALGSLYRKSRDGVRRSARHIPRLTEEFCDEEIKLNRKSPNYPKTLYGKKRHSILKRACYEKYPIGHEKSVAMYGPYSRDRPLLEMSGLSDIDLFDKLQVPYPLGTQRLIPRLHPRRGGRAGSVDPNHSILRSLPDLCAFSERTLYPF